MGAWGRAGRCVFSALAVMALGSACTGDEPQDAQAGLPVDVSAGGPYRVRAGDSLVVEAEVSLQGQRRVVRDLTAIGEALARYHDDHGTYPPVALAAPDGTPLLSWRVLLLPYLGDEAAALYERIDLTKPWDDPVNRRVLADIPAVYRGVGATQRSEGDTGYAGVAGPKTLFGAAATTLDGGVRLNDVTDGANMTAVVGPVGDAVRIPWTAPRDVLVDEVAALGTPDGFAGPGGVGTPLLFLDGAVRTMADTTDPSVVESWSTIAGDTCIPPEWIEMRFAMRWDLDGDGKFEQPGRSATIDSVAGGERTIGVQVIDDLGGIHTSTTRVIGAVR